MFKKLTLLLLFTTVLSGCGFDEPSDEGCVDPNTSMEEVSEMDFTDHFTICKSLDKNAVINNVFDEIEPNQPLYEANEFITEDQASINNSSALQVQRSAALNFKMLDDLSEFYRSQTEIITIVLLVIFGSAMAFIAAYQKSNPSASLLNKISKSVISYSMSIFIIVAFVFYQEPIKNVGRAALSTANGFAKNIMASLYQETTFNRKLIEADFNNQAHILLESALKTGICVNENRKTWIQNMEFTAADTPWDDLDGLVDFYNKKDDSYYLRTQTRDGHGIRYHYKGDAAYPVLSGIEAIGCGTINFKSNKYSGDMVSILRTVKFSSSVYNAVVAKDFNLGWEQMMARFDKLNPVETNTVINRKKQLLVAYKKEYLKGLIAGAVLFSEKTGRPIKKDTTHFDDLMSKVDEMYKGINKAVCIVNNNIVIETEGKLKALKETGQAGFYYCMDLSQNPPVLASNKKYLPKNGSEEAKAEAEHKREQDFEREAYAGRNLFKDYRQDIADDYKELHEDFGDIVDTLYDHDKMLVRNYNCGIRCLQDYWKLMKNGNTELAQLYNVNGFVQSFDYTKALPYYNTVADSEIDSYAKIYTVDLVEKFIEKDSVDFDIIHRLTEMNGNIATEMLKTEHQVGVIGVETEYQGGVEETAGFMDTFVGLLRNQNRFWCLENKQEEYRDQCIENMVNGGGAKTWAEMQKGFMQWGAGITVAGKVTQHTSGTLANLAEKALDSINKKDQKDSKSFKMGKKKKSSKASKIAAGAAGVAIVAATVAEMIGGMMIMTGMVMVIFSLLMSVPDLFIESMLVINGLSTALLLRLMPILILSTAVMLVCFGTNSKNIQKYGFYLSRMIAATFGLAVMCNIVVASSLYTTDLIKNYAATVIGVDMFSGTFVVDSGWSMGIGIILMAINSVILFVPLLIITYVLVKIPGWIARAADAHDPNLMKTRTDDADEQNQFVKNTMVVGGLRLSKQVSGLDKIKEKRDAAKERAKKAMEDKIKNNSNVSVDKISK